MRDNPMLESKRRKIMIEAARKLDKATMILFDERTGYLHATDLGWTASHFYIKCNPLSKTKYVLRIPLGWNFFGEKGL